ncbi:MAG: PAS-domain containing protein, partial [Pseudomonadota bacterium]
GMPSDRLRALLVRFVGTQEAQAAFDDYAVAAEQAAPTEVDARLAQLAESRLARIMGASSARALMTGALTGQGLRIEDVASLLDATSQELQFSRELLQITLENISQGVAVIDRDLRLVAWNSAYLRLYSYPQGFASVGRPIADLIRYNAERGECGDGDVDEHVARRLAHLRTGRPHTHERARPNGTVVKLEGAPTAGGGYVTSFTDVTSYKEIERALIDSERRIRFYTDAIPSMIAYVNTDEEIQFANKAYRETFGRPGEDIIGVRLADVHTPDAYACRKTKIAAALGGATITFDIELSDMAGGARLYQVTYAPRRGREGDVLGFFGLYQDVSARRAAERALAEANETLEERVAARTRELSALNAALDEARAEAEQATASKTKFLAAASHDVLQPLNAARLFASALSEEVGSDGPPAELAEKISASIASADRLLRALLNISKLDAGGIQPELGAFSLNELFEELRNEFSVIAAEEALMLRVRPTDLWVRSDRGLLMSILQNLVSNALRYTDEGGVLLACRVKDGAARIEIYDTGRGIPPEKLREVFGEFQRLPRDAARPGAGLGLAIVDRTAKLLGHPLDVVSTESRGTRFAITAPTTRPKADADAGATPLSASRRPASSLLSGRRVLCIDNERQILDALSALLIRWGAEAITATGLAEARANLGDGPPPDLVLLDYRLDDGATGVAVYEALTADWGGARPPAILITASQSDGFQQQADEIGAPVLSKPVEPAALRALISQMLRAAAE